VAAHGGIGGHEGKWCAAALTPRIKESSRPHFQSDGDLRSRLRRKRTKSNY
jgi:hypothetical protein